VARPRCPAAGVWTMNNPVTTVRMRAARPARGGGGWQPCSPNRHVSPLSHHASLRTVPWELRRRYRSRRVRASLVHSTQGGTFSAVVPFVPLMPLLWGGYGTVMKSGQLPLLVTLLSLIEHQPHAPMS